MTPLSEALDRLYRASGPCPCPLDEYHRAVHSARLAEARQAALGALRTHADLQSELAAKEAKRRKRAARPRIRADVRT